MITKPKTLAHISQIEFKEFFLNKGTNLKQSLLLSFDCDRTIIDRNKSSHHINIEIINLFAQLQAHPQLIPIINTGRDLTNYQPIQRQLKGDMPCIFLSGRVIKQKMNIETAAQALLPLSFKEKVWEYFYRGSIPFIEVKYEQGLLFFTYCDRQVEDLLAHHRPADWYKNLEKPIIDVKEKDLSKDIFMNLPIVRMEIPFLKRNCLLIYQLIYQKKQLELEQNLIEFFHLDQDHPLLFVPVHTAAFKEKEGKEIGSVRVMVKNEHINKGIGLKNLAHKMEIAEANIICFGDSSGETAGDQIIKTHLPQATLLITDEGDLLAKQKADYLIPSVSYNGVTLAVNRILDLLKN